MAKMNIDPVMTFQDGSRLLISTKYIGDANFKCELYVSTRCDDNVSTQCDEKKLELRMVSPYSIEASTCREAQEKAYFHAVRLYPQASVDMKKPPYLIWQGPAIPIDR
jgi:hypothetical protein